MDVPGHVTTKLVDKLYEKIIQKEFPSDKKVRKGQVWNAEVGSNKLVLLYFGATPEYFPMLKSKGKKGGLIPINNYSLVKALEYILDIPLDEYYAGENWEDRANSLLKGFEKDYIKEDSEEHDKKDLNLPNDVLFSIKTGLVSGVIYFNDTNVYDDINFPSGVIGIDKLNSLYGVLTNPYKIPEVGICTEVGSSFLKNLSSKEKFHSWKLLTTDYQKSFWEYGYAEFRDSLAMLKDIDNIHFIFESFYYKCLNFSVEYRETFIELDLISLLSKKNKSTKEAQILETIDRLVSRIYFQGEIKTLETLDKNILQSYSFQSYLISVSGFLRNTLVNGNIKSKTSNRIVKQKMIFVYIYDTWLIHKAAQIEPCKPFNDFWHPDYFWDSRGG